MSSGQFSSYGIQSETVSTSGWGHCCEAASKVVHVHTIHQHKCTCVTGDLCDLVMWDITVTLES